MIWCLQCFDTVGYVAEEHPASKKMSDEVLMRLSVWSKVQMICTLSSCCHCHAVISCFIKMQNGSAFLVPAYPGCPGKEAIKWVIGCSSCSVWYVIFEFCHRLWWSTVVVGQFQTLCDYGGKRSVVRHWCCSYLTSWTNCCHVFEFETRLKVYLFCHEIVIINL